MPYHALPGEDSLAYQYCKSSVWWKVVKGTQSELSYRQQRSESSHGDVMRHSHPLDLGRQRDTHPGDWAKHIVRIGRLVRAQTNSEFPRHPRGSVLFVLLLGDG